MESSNKYELDIGNIWRWIYQKEKKEPGTIWCFAATLTSFILVAVALGAQSSKNPSMTSIFIAEIDYSNTNWSNVSPHTQRTFNGALPFQRLGIFHNCEGTKQNNEFDPFDCYRIGAASNALDSRYPIARQNFLSKDLVELPNNSVISGSSSIAISIFMIIACFVIGISLVYQIFNFSLVVGFKIFASVFLLIANILVHVLTKRMVNSFNDNYEEYGIHASTGSKFLTIIWNAFGLLVGASITQSIRLSKSNDKQNPSPQFDPEAMTKEEYQRDATSSQKTYVTQGSYGGDKKMNDNQYYNPPPPTYQRTKD